MPDYSALEGLYQVRETIGSGGFAKVKLGVHVLTGEKVAIKIMDKNYLADEIPRIRMEIEAMKNLMHQNICKLYQVIETKDKFFMILEHCSGGELYEYIVDNDLVPEDEARLLFRQIISAVAHVHDQGFVHRDLKPENLLLNEGLTLKLIDFGLCTPQKGGMSSKLDTCCGSPAYAAPELVDGNQYFGCETDLWSMGILLYTLLCGCLPFEDQNISNLYKKIKAGIYDVPDFLSAGSADVIQKLLQVDPKLRATIEDLIEDPWVSEEVDEPLSWASQLTRDVLDDDCLTLLSSYHEKTKEEMHRLLMEWNFDHLTATYLLLLHKKTNGKPLRLGTHSSNGIAKNQLNLKNLRPDFPNGPCPALHEKLEKKEGKENLPVVDDGWKQKNGHHEMSSILVRNAEDFSPGAEPTLRQQMPPEKLEKEECIKVISLVERDCEKTRACSANHDSLALEWPHIPESQQDACDDRNSCDFEEEKSGRDEDPLQSPSTSNDDSLSETRVAEDMSEKCDVCAWHSDTKGCYSQCSGCQGPGLSSLSHAVEKFQDDELMHCFTENDKPDQPVTVSCSDEFRFVGIACNGARGWERKTGRTGVGSYPTVHRSKCFHKGPKGKAFRASGHHKEDSHKSQSWTTALVPSTGRKAMRGCSGWKHLSITDSFKGLILSSVDHKRHQKVQLNGLDDQKFVLVKGSGCFNICRGDGGFCHHDQDTDFGRKSRYDTPCRVTGFPAVKCNTGKFSVLKGKKMPRTQRLVGVSPSRCPITVPQQKKTSLSTSAMSALMNSMKKANSSKSIFAQGNMTMSLSASRSYDSQLNKLSQGKRWSSPNIDLVSGSVDADLNRLHLNKEASQSKLQRKSVFSSVERSLDRLLCVTTPRIKFDQIEPRKSVRNMYVTNYDCPNSVLLRLKAILEEKGVPHRETGYSLRSVLADESNKVQLAFDFEVVRLHKLGAVGVQCRMVKGDAWHYKRLCESIMTAAQL